MTGGKPTLSFCPYCGHKRILEGRFCVACGRAFPGAACTGTIVTVGEGFFSAAGIWHGVR
jgi:hypothetical protein